MDPALLPNVGPIINANKDSLALFGPYFSIKRKRVLCVGYTQNELAELIEPRQPAEIVCLTNWASHEDALVTKHPLIVGDLCKRTTFADQSFDAIVQLSVLEHLHDVEGAFIEMRRLLRPGGYASLVFGPSWSSPYGHHLFIDGDDPLLNFVSWRLPAHIHLLCEPDEIRGWYRAKDYSEEHITRVIHWLFEADIINRVFYDDYVRLMTKHFQLISCDIMHHHLPAAHLGRLREKFPDRLDFSSYGGRYLLQAM